MLFGVKYSAVFVRLLLCIVVLILQACSSVGYYTQSVVGHTSLMLARKPIDEVIKTADSPLKQKLIVSQDIRRFSIDKLALPDNKSYTSYVALKKSAPVWVVVAAQEFSLTPKSWCYLVIGCASYRGYYSQKSADKYAKKLQKKGYDIQVTGVGAYSTLGYFADPITSVMLERDSASLAELIFHELSHQKIYIKNNTRFNEAFATVVGEQGAIAWLKNNNQYELLNNYKTRLSVQDDFIGLVNKVKIKLKKLYGSSFSDDAKRSEKQRIFDQMKKDYKVLTVEKWGGREWYAGWFSKPLNNARLVSIATYYDLVPAFVSLFENCNRDFKEFYKQVKLNSKSKEKSINTLCNSK